MTAKEIYQVDEEIATEQLSDNLWMAWYPSCNVDGYGTTEVEAMQALVPKFLDYLNAMSDDERGVWFEASTSLAS